MHAFQQQFKSSRAAFAWKYSTNQLHAVSVNISSVARVSKCGSGGEWVAPNANSYSSADSYHGTRWMIWTSFNSDALKSQTVLTLTRTYRFMRINAMHRPKSVSQFTAYKSFAIRMIIAPISSVSVSTWNLGARSAKWLEIKRSG